MPWWAGLCTIVMLVTAAVSASMLAADAARVLALPLRSWAARNYTAAVAAVGSFVQVFVLWLSSGAATRRRQRGCVRFVGACSGGEDGGAAGQQLALAGDLDGDRSRKRYRITLAVEAPSSYADALCAMQAHPYNSVLQSAQVHVRLAGVQPEQLKPGWRADIEDHLTNRGWCLLNAAVRRGSICISFSIANMRPPPASATDSAAVSEANSLRGSAGHGAPATSCQDGPEVPFLSPRSPLSLTSSPAADTAALVAPGELLSALGLHPEDLSPGFSFNVQAVTDGGLCQRTSFTIQPDGSWASEPSQPLGDSTTSFRPPAGSNREDESQQQQQEGQRQQRHATAGSGTQVSSSLDGHRCDRRSVYSCSGSGSESESEGGVPSASAVSGSGAGSCECGSQEDASDGFTAPATVAEPLRWEMRAPLVLVGVPEPRRGSAGGDDVNATVRRYDGRVWAGPAAGPAAQGRGGEAAYPGGEYALSYAGGAWDVDMGDVEFRARPLDPVGRLAEFRVQAVPLQPHPAEAVAGSSGFGGETTRPSCSSRSEDSTGGRCGSNSGGWATWALTLWDEVPEAVAKVNPPLGPRTTLHGSIADGGTSSNEGWDGTAARGAAADGPRAPGARLVDLSLWRGRELLAASVLLLVPSGPGGGDGSGRGMCDPWVTELQELLGTLPRDLRQHVLVDLGLLLSGALRGVADGVVTGTVAVHGLSEQAGGGAAPGGRRAGGKDAQQRLLLTLDMGCNLLSLVLKHGACGPAAELWAALGVLGFGAEEVLLHAAGMTADVPPLHAAVASGKPQAVKLALSWYAAARLLEPWLQPLALPGTPAVLTPLVLASAASPPGDLLSYILWHHPQALAAWRTPVNGASGRSAAVAAGLRRVVLLADLWTAESLVEPLAAAVAAAARRCRRRLRGTAGQPQAVRNSAAGRAPDAAGGRGSPIAGAGAAVVQKCGVHCGWSVRQALAGTRHDAWPLTAGKPGELGAGRGRAEVALELDMLVAQRTRIQSLLFQCAIVTYQVVAQMKAIIWTFNAACPMASAAAAAAAANATTGSWASLGLARAIARCLVGRYWWTILEVALAAALASPLGLRHYTPCCAVAAVLRCLFQAGEGALLPPSGMSATGGQMRLASFLFVVTTAYGFQPSSRVNVLLRLVEGLAASRTYVKYGVTDRLALAVVQAVAMNGLGWLLTAVLRGRTERALRWQQGRRAQLQHGSPLVGGHRLKQQRAASGGDDEASGPSSVGAQKGGWS